MESDEFFDLSERPRLELSPEPEPTWKERRRGRKRAAKSKGKVQVVVPEVDAGMMAEAAGVSLHAMMMAELEALGDEDGGREDAGPEGEGRLHHLDYDRTKGWMLRVTVEVGKKVIGKRLKFRLRTRDAAEAERARDLVLATLKRLGLRVRLRMQGRQGAGLKRGGSEGRVIGDR
ncbi:hypothetical protein [Luteolibacter soli]|uniref:Uncharacterized protein n=1 Tax=Luteolibacter soli TaxID=3135280 RepID=A0ABU9AV70_9BACT